MEITPDKRRLVDLVEKAESGEIMLPEFQRNFVWSRDDIRDLLVSVLKDYFVGSFLLLRVDADHRPFAMRHVMGVDQHAKLRKPEWLVLDGQQRLTSLHYAFKAPSIALKWTKHPYRFFLNLGKLLDMEDAIFSERADLCGAYLEPVRQFTSLVVPFTEIPCWDKWLNDYEQWLIHKDQDLYFNEYFPVLKPLWNRAMDVIRNFTVSVVELPKVQNDDADGVAEVCAIFERLNTKGVALSIFDLLTARLFPSRIDLHRLWEQALEKNPLLCRLSEGDPDIFGVYAVRALALIRDQEIKTKTLINVSPANFRKDWEKATHYLEQALARISSTSSDGFGAFDQKWIPYSTMAPVLAALLEMIDRGKFDHRAYDGIKKWYWGSVFLERYAGAVESTSRGDYTSLVQWFKEPSSVRAVFQEIERSLVGNPAFTIRGVSRVNSTYRGVMNLVAIGGAKDFQANDAIEFHSLDDHHIFPRGFLEPLRDRNGNRLYDQDLVNSIVNKTLITQQTNRRISRMSPRDYVQKIIPSEKRRGILRSHLISDEAIDAMENNDYPRFLRERENAILRALRAVLSP